MTQIEPTSTRSRTVDASDGVELAVRSWGNPEADLTVIFAHGYCLRGVSWRQQIELLIQRHDVHAITYDQRGHGDSGTPAPSSCTIAQLGADLQAVIEATAPRTPVITVGHSMGAMALLAHAGLCSDQIGSHIVGTMLLAGAPQGLTHCGIGAPWNKPILDLLRWSLDVAPRPANTIKDVLLAALGPAAQICLYGRKPKLRAQRPAEFIGATPLATIAGFLHTLEFHDETTALPILGRIPVVVVGGTEDLATPIECSRHLAQRIPGARLIEIPDTGHLVHLERPPVVADLLSDLVSGSDSRTCARTGQIAGAS